MGKPGQNQKLLKFIDLDRRFRKLNPQENPEEAALESYTASLLGLKTGLDWQGLLEWPLVVVLGEPGSGKTWEFRERARILQDRGEKSFFIPLDRLITESLTQILSEEECKIFHLWLKNNEKASFFLDSADEAKYRRTADFLVAIDHFRNAIGASNLRRMRLLVSSRISEWRPQSDAHELIWRFPQPPPLKSKNPESDTNQAGEKNNKQEEILVVQIEPLDRSRVERFTRELNVVDPVAFVRALDEKYAWPFARRPIDVIDLLNYWNTHHRLGSLKELIEHDLNQKLKESREKQDLLTPEKARQGAEILGAAVVFCKNFNFRVPDDSHLGETVALDSSSCLPADWLPMESHSLLTRPLFDSASYGRIRFHHRRSAEYLASRWLENLMKGGCTKPILEDLLFTRIKDQDILRPSLAPVAAWLCAGKERWQADIGNRILKAAPWIHLLHGDPSQLSVEYRRSLLKALVERYEGRKRVWINAEYESLSRLADPGLTDDLLEIIRNRRISTDVRSEMLRLVQHGRLTGCLDAILDLVADKSESDDLKIYAAIALRDAGETPHLLRLWEIIKQYPRISTRLCARCCEALYPKVIDAEGLADLLRKSEAVPSNAVDLPYYLRHHLEEVLTPEASGPVLIQLAALLEQLPHVKKDSGETPISANFYWLGEVIPFVLKVLLEKNRLTEAEADASARAFWLLGRLHRDMAVHKPDPQADLNVLTGRHPEVRWRFFWHLIDERKRKKRSEVELTYPIHLFSQLDVLKPIPGDLEWAIDDIKTRKEEADRVIALRMAIDLWYMAGGKWRDRRLIHGATANDASLLKEFKKLAEYGPRVWIKRIWYRHLNKLSDKWWWKSRFYSVRQRYWELQWWWAYHRHVRLLKNGQATGWLSDLAREADESHSQWAPRTWDKLVEKRGRLIAWAAREGCKSVWQQFVPLLPHEKPNPSQTDHRVIAGLAGLQAAFSDNELDFKQLTEDEARLAVRYAVNEMSGFPLWFPELAKQHPLAVQNVLTECICGEWQFEAKREHAHEVLSVLSWHGEGLLPLIRDSIIAQISSGDPPNASVLETALSLLLKDSDFFATTLARIAADRITQYSTDSRGFILWLVVWLQLSAGLALRYLQQILSRIPDADELMVRLCDMLRGDSGHRIPSLSSPDYAEPTHLRTFLPLIYRHIRPTEHIDPVGGRMMTARDDARRFRDSLLERLSQSESAEAGDVLHEFLQEPAFVSHRDYILHLLDQRAERQADSPPWHPEDIRTFAKNYETDPKTNRDVFKIDYSRLHEVSAVRTDGDGMDWWTVKQLRAMILTDLRDFVPHGYFESEAERFKLHDGIKNSDHFSRELRWGYLAGQLGRKLFFESTAIMSARQVSASEVLMNLGMLAATEAAQGATMQLAEDAEAKGVSDGNAGVVVEQLRSQHIPTLSKNVRGALGQYLCYLTPLEAKPFLPLAEDVLSDEDIDKNDDKEHPNIRLLIKRMDTALANDDPSGVLHASASVFETLAKDVINIEAVQDQTLASFFNRYRKDSKLPSEILDYILDTYKQRNKEPLAGHGSTKTPTITGEKAIILVELTKAFVRIERQLSSMSIRLELTEK